MKSSIQSIPFLAAVAAAQGERRHVGAGPFEDIGDGFAKAQPGTGADIDDMSLLHNTDLSDFPAIRSEPPKG